MTFFKGGCGIQSNRKKKEDKKSIRDAKKNPNKRQKLKKDPGVPNLLAVKENLMKKIERPQNKKSNDMEVILTKQEHYENMLKKAEKAEENYESKNQKEERENFVDTSRKTFFKEFKKVIKASDVILEVLDARDPLGTRCKDIEMQILQEDPSKKIVLVLNKIDLIPRENLQQWLKYLRLEMPTIAFKSSVQGNRVKLGQSNVNAEDHNQNGTSECLGATTLLSLLKNYSRSRDIKLSITVGIIGIPNVGKSSLINSLKRVKAVNVGSTPGVTRTLQEVHLDKNIKLLDCPGIVFTSSNSEAEAALKNAVMINQINDIMSPVELILEKSTVDQLMHLYKIERYENSIEFLTYVAQKRCKLKSGGIVDLEGAAKLVLQDWIRGKIPYISCPPSTSHSLLETNIVSDWKKEFNIHEIEKIEVEVIDSLPTEEQFKSIQYVSIETPMNNEEMSVDGEERMEMDEKTTQKTKKITAQDDHNHQINLMKKLSAKKKKKAEKKRKRGMDDDMQEESDGDENNEYDFGEDFWTS